MTSAVYRGTPSLDLPQTQNTAPVLEFNCMYTHDIRRKQKRWQDGFLRYHTFNKRIMVYDVPRNFIGDAHWKAEEVLQDGDEITLEKDGVMVQVAERVGRTETDLSELRKSAKKSSSLRGSSPPAREVQTPTVRPAASKPKQQQGPSAPMQLKHRSLNALLGGSRGPIGKATLSSKSPFEIRAENAENVEWESDRAPKRQRLNNSASSLKRDEAPLWARTVDAAKAKKSAPLRPGQPWLRSKEYVDLSKDDDERFLAGFSSDALQPRSSPPRQTAAVETRSPPQPPGQLSSPAFQTQKLSEVSRQGSNTSRFPIEVDAQARPWTSEAGGTRPTANDPQRDASLRSRQPSNGEEASNVDLRTHRSPSISAIEEPPTRKAGQTLRMTAHSSKRKTLLCQDQLSGKPKTMLTKDNGVEPDVLLETISDDKTEAAPKGQQQHLEAGFARIDKVVAKPHSKRSISEVSVSKAARLPTAPKDRTPRGNTLDPKVTRQLTSYEASALELAEMDETLLQSEASQHYAAASVSHSDTTQNLIHPDAQPAAKRSSKTKTGVGRREIRACAQSCFQRPASESSALDEAARRPEAMHSPEAAQPPRDVAYSPNPAQPHQAAQRLREPVFQLQAAPPSGEAAQSAREPTPPPEAAHLARDAAQPPPPRKSERPFRKAFSETVAVADAQPRRTPGAPMRFTPSPSKRQGAAAAAPNQPPAVDSNARPAFPTKSRAKKPLQRAVTYNTTANGTATVMLAKPFQPPKPHSEVPDTAPPPVANPWSREAFDLFDWRPPGWDEEAWCVKAVDGVVGEVG